MKLATAATLLNLAALSSGFSAPNGQRARALSRLDSTATADATTKEELFVKWMTTDVFDEIPHPGNKLEVLGSIPSYVKGAYIKNGPGAFSTPDGSRRYTHAFDGLAKLQKFDIEGGEVTFTARFVDSKVKKSMLEENTIPGHVSVGPVEPPFKWWEVLKGTFDWDNTCVNLEELSSTGTICAVSDAEVKNEIDIGTLETVRMLDSSQIEGAVGITMFSTAHSKVSRRDGLTYNYYLDIGLENRAHIVRRNHDLTQTSIGSVKLESKFSYVHEISMTDNYAVLVQHPVFVDMVKVFKESMLMPTVEFDPSVNTKIYLFDLEGKKPVEMFEAPPCWSYHHANAYEEGSNVVLDLIAYETPYMANSPHAYLYPDNMKTEETRLKQAREGAVWRFNMDLEGGERMVIPEKKTMIDKETGLPLTIELTSVAPDHLGKPYRFVYGFTGFHQGKLGYMDWAILKQDVGENEPHLTWYEEFMYPGEVTFVRDPDGTNEDDGVLLATVYDARRNENCLLVLDACNMKELARAYTGVGL